MTQDEVIEMFRSEADCLPLKLHVANETILELAQLLAESRGRLSKETFETLVRIGGMLYKEGRDRFDARQDVAAIMKKSVEDRSQK